MDVVSILQQVALFQGLDDSQLVAIKDIAQQHTFAEGDVITKQGDIADCMYIVNEGQVSVIVDQHDGSRDLMVYLGQGQVVGEMTLVDMGKRSASVMAAEDNTKVITIPNESFTALCEANTAIGYRIMKNIAQDLSFKLRHLDLNMQSRVNGEGDV